MGEARKSGWFRTSLEIFPENITPEISDNVQQALARLFLWDALNKTWIEAAGDANGRILITPGVSDYTGLSVRGVNVLVTETVIMNPNPKRQFARLLNGGGNEISLGFKVGDAAGAPIIWPNNIDFLITGYTGPVYGIAAVATINVAILEM